MKKQLKDYLKTQFDYDPISFERKNLYMQTEMEKAERKAAGIYFILSIVAIAATSAILLFIIFLTKSI